MAAFVPLVITERAFDHSSRQIERRQNAEHTRASRAG
jgi:hypothetical protein